MTASEEREPDHAVSPRRIPLRGYVVSRLLYPAHACVAKGLRSTAVADPFPHSFVDIYLSKFVHELIPHRIFMSPP